MKLALHYHVLPHDVVRKQNRLWELVSRHTTMTLIILYLVYTQVSTVVSVYIKTMRNKLRRGQSKRPSLLISGPSDAGAWR